MLGFVAEIRRGLFNAIQRYVDFSAYGRHADYIKKYTHDIVVAFVAYDIIEEQLRSGNVYLKSYNELQNRMSAFLAAHPGVMGLFRRFRLSTTLGGGTGWPPGGGPPPPPGGPGGPPPPGGPDQPSGSSGLG